MTCFRLLVLVLVLAFGGSPPASAQDEPRYALVIGNAAYGLGALKNPINDARSMASVLLEAGFETTLLENLDKAAFNAALDTFLGTLPSGSVALFYYAGHAIQSDGRNFLLPVDIAPGSVESVQQASVAADTIVNRFHDAGISFGIFILDACRDNPFAQEGSERGRGLAFMESTAGETLIGFATQAGEVAFDGGGLNSPYTGALVSEIDKGGRDILEVFRSVRRSVRIWTDGRQRPFISASVEREFYFRQREAAPTVQVDLGDLTVETVRPAVERIWWTAIEDSQDPADFRAFLDQYASSEHAPTARSLADDLAARGVQVRGLDLVQFVPDGQRSTPESLASVLTPCDVVASDPDDPRRIADGVKWGLVNTRLAVRECSAALSADPTNARLLHQMGRLLDILGRYGEAEGFYRLAGSMDYSASLVNLGFFYSAARGRDRDYAEALRLYRRAADLGNLRGRTNIGVFFERGWGVEADLDEAARWYRLAAQNGWPNALDTLGNLYRRGQGEDGRGLPKDTVEAIRLYKVAAELDNSNAMNNLGQLYLRGEATGTPDVAEGIRWLSLASEAGNPYAPFNLGRLYRDGDVVERDEELAVELFLRSMDQGFVPARIALAAMYADGRGVERDIDEAAYQLAIAARIGDERKPDEKPEAIKRLDQLALPADRLSAAEERAEQWLRTNGG
jgi:uncharacterized protein